MVSFFDGKLSRTWKYECDGEIHTINLFHDTITGIRCALLDSEEIVGSYGHSTLMMDVDAAGNGHRLKFSINDKQGFIEISKNGWLGFQYKCVINNEIILETTQSLAKNQGVAKYKVNFLSTCFSADDLSPKQVTWYYLECIRLEDKLSTKVHR